MGTVWFCLVAVMLAGYVVLDGFDIGAGILHLWIARTEVERRAVLRSIGSVWDGNEVWLIAGGGTLYFAFPALYAASFSGFYLPLMMVLWLLILRGISIEFRSHVGGRVWSVFWDATFAVASILLAVFFGAALGNVVRGVPLDASGSFFEPLWTNFQPAGNTGILDWYTILIGVAALAALALHGATWIGYKTEGALYERAMRWASLLWWLVAAFTVIVTITSFRLLPQHMQSFRLHPLGFVFPVLAIAGFLGIKWFVRARQEGMAFAASCAYIAGMLTSVAFSLYPNVLPASTNPFFGLTIANSKAADYGLKIGLIWWIIGMALATGYTVHSYRSISGKVSASDGEENRHY
ncbi:MAG: cytochrome d ubiquinol oxidase subunit II [Candidatus Acidiferrales bacterium]